MLTYELLEAHRDALKEKKSTIAELRREVEELASKGKLADKISQLQANLDHEAEVQSSREMELERLQRECQGRGDLVVSAGGGLGRAGEEGLRVEKGLRVAGGECRVATERSRAAEQGVRTAVDSRGSGGGAPIR